jgi:nucleotide-binding universal stress UspA family protein
MIWERSQAMIQTILLATDGSMSAERALQYAASLARNYRTRMIVVHAFLPGSGQGNQTPNSIYETRDQAIALVRQAANRLKELGISEVETVVVPGPAVNVIIGAVETHHPDILVVGARGQSLWPGTQMGSISMAVTQRVECPVLVVR